MDVEKSGVNLPTSGQKIERFIQNDGKIELDLGNTAVLPGEKEGVLRTLKEAVTDGRSYVKIEYGHIELVKEPRLASTCNCS